MQDVVEAAAAEEPVVEHLVVKRKGVENKRLVLELLSLLFALGRFARKTAQEEPEQLSEALPHGKDPASSAAKRHGRVWPAPAPVPSATGTNLANPQGILLPVAAQSRAYPFLTAGPAAPLW